MQFEILDLNLAVRQRRSFIQNLRVNEEIRASEVFLIDENGKPIGKVSYDQAMYLAYEKGLDLVEVGPNARPPVCKFADYGKYKYELEKKQSKQKVKGKAPELKEIRLSLKISQHDFDFKAQRAKEFLARGDKVRIFLKLIGREIMFQEKVRELMERFKQAADGKYEQPPIKLGRNFNAIITR